MLFVLVCADANVVATDVVLARAAGAAAAELKFADAPSGFGCLKTPKLSDFFCGCTLHAMVWPEWPFTQRTRYDCLHVFKTVSTCLDQIAM